MIDDRAELLDMFYVYRLLLGRMPSDVELNYITSLRTTTWREYLSTVLASVEYEKRLDFLPAGMELMSEENGFRFWFRSADREMGAVMASGRYEPAVTAYLQSIIKPGMCCLDIGAQTGYFTILMAKGVGSFGRVIAFEPFEESYRLLNKNVSENCLDGFVEIHNLACADLTGSIQVGNASGMVVSDPEGDKIINCVSLDDFIENHIDICKLDVEGHEPRVVAGMRSLIQRYRPIIITEINEYWLRRGGGSSLGYIDQLHNLGYTLFDIDRGLIPLDLNDFEGSLKTSNVVALQI
jgi:FkbM family methyltransferase